MRQIYETLRVHKVIFLVNDPAVSRGFVEALHSSPPREIVIGLWSLVVPELLEEALFVGCYLLLGVKASVRGCYVSVSTASIGGISYVLRRCSLVI